MDSSGNASLAGTGPRENDTSTPKPDVKRSSWFTPCKQLGLKRKSSSMSTPGSAMSSGSTPNSSFKSHRPQFVTPTRLNTFGAKIVDRGKTSLQTPVCVGLVQDEPSSTPTECIVAKSSDPFKTSIPSPCNKLTPIRCRRRPMVITKSTIIGGEQTTPKPEHYVNETETLELEELTEENVELIRQRVKEKEERVSALKLTQVYKKKHNTEKLMKLTKKWRSGCQEALQQLLEKTRALGYQHTMPELLAQLRIPNDLVQYDADLEDFKE